MVGISLASAAARPSLVGAASKVPSSLVALRGGAAIGPLDANAMMVINLVAMVGYIIEMAFPSITNPPSKYFGTSWSPFLPWFALALLWLTGLFVYCKYSLDVGDVDLLKFATGIWLTSIAHQLYQIKEGVMKTKEPLYIIGTIVLLTAYVAFA